MTLTREARRIPSLDGLRALSIGLVLLDHAKNTRGFPAWIPGGLVDHGQIGVHIFFVISGFLITRLLAEEIDRTGGISLGLFYARRSVRILPPCYVFLAIIAALTALRYFAISPGNFAFAVTYTMNYVPQGLWLTGHLWSLSVEEQFYLVWPFTVKLAGLRRACLGAGAIALAAPMVSLAVYLARPDLFRRVTLYFPLAADSIAAGCALAWGLSWLRGRRIFGWFSAAGGDLVLPLILILDLGRPHPLIHTAFTETARNLCICYAIVRYTEFPEGFVGRILNASAVAFAGRLSYSLYLWQELFLDPARRGLPQTFPLNLILALACALGSYWFVELPLGGIRKRLRARSLSPARSPRRRTASSLANTARP